MPDNRVRKPRQLCWVIRSDKRAAPGFLREQRDGRWQLRTFATREEAREYKRRRGYRFAKWTVVRVEVPKL